MPLLHFLAADVMYCLSVDSVTRIIPLVALSPSPVDESYLLGILNYHGSPVPVIDVNILKGRLHSESYSKEHSIIICQAGALFGVICTEISDIDAVEVISDVSGTSSGFDCITRQESISHRLDVNDLSATLPSLNSHGNLGYC